MARPIWYFRFARINFSQKMHFLTLVNLGFRGAIDFSFEYGIFFNFCVGVEERARKISFLGRKFDLISTGNTAKKPGKYVFAFHCASKGKMATLASIDNNLPSKFT